MNKSKVKQIVMFFFLLTFSTGSLAFPSNVVDPICRNKVNFVELTVMEFSIQNSLTGSIWQMQMDENKDKRGVLKNISFGIKGVMIEASVYYSDGYITKIDKENSTIFRETPNGIIVFDSEGENPFLKKVKWIGENQILYEGYIYARLGSDEDNFTKDYTEPYVERIVKNGGVVEAYFLQDMAIKYCHVDGNAYQLKGEPEDAEGYLSLEFRDSGTCSWKKSKLFTMGFKDYNDQGSELWLRPHKPFANPNRGEWTEKWKLKWLNIHEFTLSKDGKSYHYKYIGKAKQEESLSE